MTANLIMYDDVTVSSLPPGASYYAAYLHGTYANYDAVKARFPGATILGIATRASIQGQCLDCEPGDATPAQVPAWVKMMKATGLARPVVYCSASAVSTVISYCTAAGLNRYTDYLIWSAHYTHSHVCSPSVCGYPAADGTQWTDSALGRSLDQSSLDPNFFDYMNGTHAGPPPVPPVTGVILKLGDSGSAVITMQQRLIAWGYLGPGQDDGAFGPKTLTALVNFQKADKLTPDGLCGPLTLAALKTAPPVPPGKPKPVVYAPPSGLRVTGGYHSFRATWVAPAGTPAPGYSISVIDHDTGHVVPGYPRVTGSTEYQGGGLVPVHQYTLEVATQLGAAHSTLIAVPFKTA